MQFTRRDTLALGLGAAAMTVLPFRAYASATDDLIAEFTGGAEVGEGGLTLTAPEIAENGNTVPMTVSVDGPMTAQSYVEEVMIVAEGNPNPGVISFHFTPSSVAEANTRIRLAETQNVIAVARMNDGSVFSDVRQVKVTIGGCGG